MDKKSTDRVEKNSLCPVCNTKGIEVKNITVKSLVVDEIANEINDDNYFICMNEDCNTVYFNLDGSIIYDKDQVKFPIWFKKGANPKYICYCNQVTEQQIIDAVLKDDGKNMKDIIKITGAMKNAKCEEKNPLGECCSPNIQEIINKALIIKGN